MQPPKCQWKPKEHGEMKLTKETPTFWVFGCGCGCVRAVSKPSTQEQGAFSAAQRHIEQIKKFQELTSRKREYSFGGADARSIQ